MAVSVYMDPLWTDRVVQKLPIKLIRKSLKIFDGVEPFFLGNQLIIIQKSSEIHLKALVIQHIGLNLRINIPLFPPMWSYNNYIR